MIGQRVVMTALGNYQVEGLIPSRSLISHYAAVAQLVERKPEELRVRGSIPLGGTKTICLTGATGSAADS